MKRRAFIVNCLGITAAVLPIPLLASSRFSVSGDPDKLTKMGVGLDFGGYDACTFTRWWKTPDGTLHLTDYELHANLDACWRQIVNDMHHKPDVIVCTEELAQALREAGFIDQAG